MNNGIKINKKELTRMSKDLNITVEELIKYISTLEEVNLIKLDKDNILRLVK